MVSRRKFIQSAGLALAAMTGPGLSRSFAADGEARPVPFSSGTQRPTLRVPPNSCDCHHHIYDSRFPVAPNATLRPPNATVADYRKVQKWLGTTRNVVVTPSTYGTDNSCLLDALAQFGSTARGIAVIDEHISEAELKRLNDNGVRGIRYQPIRAGANSSLQTIETLTKRIEPYGWHLQVHMSAAMILEAKDLLQRLPTQIVFDHMARIPQPAGVDHPAFQVVSELLERGKAWVKVSGAYHDSKVGAPSYADTTKLAREYVRRAPDRVVWGSDWPYPSASAGERPFPDVAQLLDRLADYVPHEAVLHQILVRNPERLYGFPAA